MVLVCMDGLDTFGPPSTNIPWMDEIRSHHFETMVETITLVGIYVGNGIIPGIS